MSEDEIKKLVEQTKGRIFSVEFIKRTDNTFRKMLCRTGVRKYIRGGGRNYSPEKKNLLSVFDMKKIGYRMIPVENILEIRVNGQTYFPNDVERYTRE
jgi:hypothetical protein